MTRQPENNISPRLLLRPQEAANALGLSLRTLMSMVTSGEIPHTRIGERNLRFPLEALREWVARRTTWPTELVPGTDAGTPQPAAQCSCRADCRGRGGLFGNRQNGG
jgi:excisionase family DNA binding protein